MLSDDSVVVHVPEAWYYQFAARRRVLEAGWGRAGSKSVVEWRDSGRAIPEGDEARDLIAELEAELARRSAPGA